MRSKIIRFTSTLLVWSIFLTSCYGEMSGTVIDTETGEHIEGAVVLVEWTKTKGIGLTYTESYKVVEVLTNKEGKAKILGVYNPLVDPPDVVVYKKGYVAWSSRIIFPDYRNRTDFRWGNNYVFKLERFKDTYSYVDHSSFIDSVARPESATEEKKLFLEAYNTWERGKTIQEMREKRKRDGYR